MRALLGRTLQLLNSKSNWSTRFQHAVIAPTLHADFFMKEFVSIDEESGELNNTETTQWLDPPCTWSRRLLAAVIFSLMLACKTNQQHTHRSHTTVNICGETITTAFQKQQCIWCLFWQYSYTFLFTVLLYYAALKSWSRISRFKQWSEWIKPEQSFPPLFIHILKHPHFRLNKCTASIFILMHGPACYRCIHWLSPCLLSCWNN